VILVIIIIVTIIIIIVKLYLPFTTCKYISCQIGMCYIYINNVL